MREPPVSINNNTNMHTHAPSHAALPFLYKGLTKACMTFHLCLRVDGGVPEGPHVVSDVPESQDSPRHQ